MMLTHGARSAAQAGLSAPSRSYIAIHCAYHKLLAETQWL
jgi:hypothetical protein